MASDVPPTQCGFTCLLANLNTSTPAKNPQNERFRLIQLLLKHDIILLQEIKISYRLQHCDELKGYLKVLDSSESGILINETKFGKVESYSTQYLGSLFDGIDKSDVARDFKEQLRKQRMCVRKATLTKGNNSVLIISYHGPYTGMTDLKRQKLYTNLLKAWCLIQSSIGAQHLIIGGDFNFSVQKFRKMIPYHKHRLSVHAQVNRTEHRKGKKIIDYFVVSESIELRECVMAERYDSDPDTLNGYFDHDPIMAKFMVSACTCKPDPLTHLMHELSLLSGPSVIARESVIYDIQKTHFAGVLEQLRSCDRIWNFKTVEDLSNIVQSEPQEVKRKLNIKELRVILLYLKVKVPDSSEIEKISISNYIAQNMEKLTDIQVHYILWLLEIKINFGSHWRTDKPKQKRELLLGTLRSRRLICWLNIAVLGMSFRIAFGLSPWLIVSETAIVEHNMLADIVYQVYQWPLSNMIMRNTPSYGDLLTEFRYGMNGLNLLK